MLRTSALSFGFVFALVVGCSAGSSGTAPIVNPPVDDDAGSEIEDSSIPPKEDAGTKLCHTGGAACSDGIPCCGTSKCDDTGYCKLASGEQCMSFGFDCTTRSCCDGYTCTKFAFGSRCTIPATCAKAGAACADKGNCCGGLTCLEGKCQAPPREKNCKIFGEQCGAQTCCPSTPYCESMKCCMPSDWNNASCGQNSDCCSGQCKGGVCLVSDLGGACTFDEDCGIKYTSPATAPHCGVAKTCCVPKAGACASGSDCCSGSCVGGSCACLPKGSPTTDSGNCCSKVSVSGTCG